MAAHYPLGGVAWSYLPYVMGLSRLGHDVYYHEDTWSWPYHPIENQYTANGEYSAKFLDDFFARHAPELRKKWHYFHIHEKSFGMSRKQFDEVARSADLFINVSGACIIPDNLPASCVKVFIDTDPGYNQIMLEQRLDWSENVDRWIKSVNDHDRHFTYAENIYGEDCLIPKAGIKWNTIRMPVVMDLWDRIASKKPSHNAPWTTVMTWNAFKGKLEYNGVEYKSKGAEFEKYLNLAKRLNVPLKVAVGGIQAPLERLADAGWNVVDGPRATLTPNDYEEFIAGSRGEFSIAKHVYVAMRSGWFSDRSACYLAAGRPVVVQDTGFSKILPVGKGILPFTTLEEAVAAIKEGERNYSLHAKAALAIAKEYFGYHKVLGQLIEDLS